jgi:hypothetical protein
VTNEPSRSDFSCIACRLLTDKAWLLQGIRSTLSTKVKLIYAAKAGVRHNQGSEP